MNVPATLNPDTGTDTEKHAERAKEKSAGRNVGLTCRVTHARFPAPSFRVHPRVSRSHASGSRLNLTRGDSPSFPNNPSGGALPPYTSPTQVECPQGQVLQWWEYDDQEQEQWFRSSHHAPLCATCWQAAHCPPQFGFPSASHEPKSGAGMSRKDAKAQRRSRCRQAGVHPPGECETKRIFLRLCAFVRPPLLPSPDLG